ncbi:response regulator [Pseudoalteromonas gelatinilytica]|uniref:histidine kinase n=1 Tax=Pseudoalteromonas gelatinilytica TaxID=1703256 RepID=A0A3A3EMB8_9GAMM|nr:response regulator [Pseudoalteromonas profundi]RJF33811.1 response regulator [Pseudoalteromonas profundi]
MLQLVTDIRKRYRWGLLAIAILISVSAILIQSLLYIQKGDAKVINIAGKQRMLSQKIALYGNALIYHESAHFQQQHRRLLQQAVEQFIAGHQFLIQQDEQGHYIHLNEALEAHYFSPPTALDEHVKRYVSKAQQLLNNTDDFAYVDRSTFVSNQLEALLTKLDQAVKLLEQKSVQKVTFLAVLELLFWLLAMTLLAIELFFIFKPMEKLVTKNIAKYKEQKEFAERVNKNKERFIARTSHEFRTPLQGLTASIEALDINDSQQLTKQQALYCVNRLVAMLDELMDLQQLTSGNWQLSFTSSNLLSTLKRAISPFEYACNDKGITLSLNLADSLNKEVSTDHARLTQIVAEIINNAVKFTPSQGRIAVTAACQGEQHFVMEIQDNGKGFEKPPTDLLSYENDSEQHFQGLKTGLLRVMHIVKALKGEIQFLNAEPQGVKVLINLELESTPKSAMPAPLPKALHCLIVEDNPLNATILGRMVSHLNYSFDVAENGLIATDKASEKHYDLIFMDLNMPVMDGFKAIDIIRNEQGQQVPILVVTANTSNDDLQRVYELGANLHVYKPITLDSVQKALSILFTESSQG